MSKKKGTKIDLTKLLDKENSNGLPTKPRERDPNDKGRFQRGKGGKGYNNYNQGGKGEKGYNNYNQGGKGYNKYLYDQMICEGKTKYEIEDKWAKIENKIGNGRKNSRFDSLKSRNNNNQLSQRQEVEVDKVAQQIIDGKAKAKEQEELALKKSKIKKDKDNKKKNEKQVEYSAYLKVLEDEKNKAIEFAKNSQDNANKLIESGEKGKRLNELLKTEKESTTARSMVTAILNEKIKNNNLTDYKWLEKDEYGSCLKNLLVGKGSIQAQASILYACQDAYQKENLPTFQNEETGNKESHFEKLLFELWNKEIIEDLEAFNEWRYGNDELDLVQDKKDVLFQISNFLQWLDEPPEEDSDDDKSNSDSNDDYIDLDNLNSHDDNNFSSDKQMLEEKEQNDSDEDSIISI